jgi:hypothetical protein
MKSLDEVIKNKLTGLYYRNRILLPFTGYILKIMVDDDILTDFSIENGKVEINEYEEFLELYFLEYEDLTEAISKFESIKLVIVEKDNDIFDFDNHRKILLYLNQNHQLSIEETDEDILFIE